MHLHWRWKFCAVADAYGSQVRVSSEELEPRCVEEKAAEGLARGDDDARPIRKNTSTVQAKAGNFRFKNVEGLS